ncbi:MAG: 30S ribosomal protein S8 [Nitrososphaerota archaeon]|nr:30S ribosomal protein S8 [Nitrososphaerota archaeon]MDG6939510.1 30S ribosomal protein S8 [Nitrososphaerota archaeon]
MAAIPNLFSTIYSNELRNRKECLVIPASRLGQEILRVMQKGKYIGEFEYVDDGMRGKLRVQLLGRINKCGSVTPRYPVGVDSYYLWERRYLPAVNVGILIVSTSKGVMSHGEAVNEGVGGRLLGYVY